MARDGWRIFDSDTHVGPDASILGAYLSTTEKDRLASWAQYEARDRHGRITYGKGQRRYASPQCTAPPPLPQFDNQERG